MQQLIQKLIEFANTRFDLSWEAAEAEAALPNFIEKHMVPLAQGMLVGADKFDMDISTSQQEYVVASFIDEVNRSDPESFKVLDQVVRASMLAAALYLPVPSDLGRRFNQTTLYLDTSICLQALGLEGEEARAATWQTLNAAIKQGAKIACFTHTVSEMRGVLAGARESLRSADRMTAPFGGVATYFHSQRASASDVELQLARLEKDLVTNGITVVDPPEYDVRSNVDESDLENFLQDRIGYRNLRACSADARSLTAVHRLRRGQLHEYVEEARAVLLTDNENLVRAARSFFKHTNVVPTAYLDQDLAVVVWVKDPQIEPDLPRSRVLADCFAALAPSEPLWEAFLAQIEKLKEEGRLSAEDIVLLRHSEESRRAVTENAMGDPAGVSAHAVMRALQRAREEIVKPVAAELDESIARRREAELASDGLQAELAAAEQDREQQSLAADQQRQQTQQAVTERHRRKGRRASRVVTVVAVFVALILAAAGGFAAFLPVGPQFSLWLRIGIFSALVGGSILSVASGVIGSWRWILDWLQNRQIEALTRDFRSHGLEDVERPTLEQWRDLVRKR